MNSQKQRSFHRSQRTGAAAVEFAIVAPVFLLLLAGIIEIGQAFRIEHALSNAARRGARSAIIEGHTSTQVSDGVKAQCTATLGVASADVTVVVAVNGAAGSDLNKAKAGDEISVTVSIPFCRAGAGFFTNLFSQSVLSSSCTLERE